MYLIKLFLLSFQFFNIYIYAFEIQSNADSLMIWPQPKYLTFGKSKVYMPSNGFSFNTYDMKSSSYKKVNTLEQAYDRYNKLIFNEHFSNQTILYPAMNSDLKVTVEDCSEEYPQLETDESYDIKSKILSYIINSIEFIR